MARDSHASRKRRNQMKAAQIRFRKKNAPPVDLIGHETFVLNPSNGRYECPDCGKTVEEMFSGVMSETDLQEMLANMY